jgi:hypothetical protein
MVSYRFFRAKLVGLAGVQMKAEVGEVNGAGTVVNLALIGGEHPAVMLRHDRTVDLRHITSVDSAPVDLESLTAWWWREAEAWCIRHGGIGHKDRAACLAEMKRLRGA